MIYDFNQIDNSDPKLPVYKLKIDVHRSEFDRFDTADVRSIVDDLQNSLPFLFDDRLTFDAETLLRTSWCNQIGSKHNRTIGSILRVMINLDLVPLVRLPKGSGTRIRFSIKF